MKRLLPFSLVVCGSILAYACSSSDSGTTPTNPSNEGGSSGSSGSSGTSGTSGTSGGPGDGGTDSPVGPTGNPIEGVGTPTDVPNFAGIYTTGPIWKTDGLYYSVVGNPSSFVKLTPPATTAPQHVAGADTALLGSTFDTKSNFFITCEAVTSAGNPSATGGGSLSRTGPTGGASMPITLGFDAGGVPFDTPEDVVARKDGTLYVADSALLSLNPAITSNHVWHLKPNAAGYDVFDVKMDGRPSGVALSPDEKTLYVALSQPEPFIPVINKHTVATDGSLGAGTKFAEVSPNDPNNPKFGVAVDTAGNVYAAGKTGVDVFKPDGTKWGKVTTTRALNGLTFGGADGKTLYMTSGTGLMQVTVKVAGLLQ